MRNAPLAALVVALTLSWVAPAASLAEEPTSSVSLGSLLAEMTDRARFARLPDPAYTLHQASSYERLSKTPSEAKGWFANHDWSHFLRKEQVAGRTEWVMMDAAGPGAVVRVWLAGPVPHGTFRFYLDGSDTPAIVSKGLEWFLGKGPVPPPLSAERARGWNLYLPIPYATRCKITYDGPNWWQTKKNPDRLWYHINYRTYAAGTKVRTFTRKQLETNRPALEKTGKTLLKPRPVEELTAEFSLYYGAKTILWRGGAVQVEYPHPQSKRFADIKLSHPDQPGSIREILVQIGEAKDMALASRQLVLVVECDGKQTVWCPIGDFFGSGVGWNTYQDWCRRVEARGVMTCRWVMPFRKNCVVRLVHLGRQPLVARLRVGYGPHKWDDRSMYFHANWRGQYPVDTGKRQDWTYLTAKGQGVYMGDTLAVMNPTTAWWGEGDEKIWIDGEKFPSHFGTGTEDYYGYAWGCSKRFEAPFHAQPRCDGPGNRGHTTVTRVRGLDAIPFARYLKVDMEVWHWKPVQMAYAAATYWYARPGATSTPKPDPKEAVRTIPAPPPPPKPFQVAGAAEGETMKVLRKTGGVTEVQRIAKYRWSGGAQLWWRDGKVGDRLVLALPAAKAGRYQIMANLTKAGDYGIVQFALDGEPLGKPMDLYHDGVTVTGPVVLGTRDLKAGPHQFSIEIKGANPKAVTRHMLGLDYILLKLSP